MSLGSEVKILAVGISKTVYRIYVLKKSKISNVIQLKNKFLNNPPNVHQQNINAKEKY